MAVEVLRKLIGGVWKTVVEDAGGGGGSQPAVATVKYFEFTHATAGLINGVTFLSVEEGDVLLDAFFSVRSGDFWDGTSFADFGDFPPNGDTGWFGSVKGAVDLSVEDFPLTTDSAISLGGFVGASDEEALQQVANIYRSPAIASTPSSVVPFFQRDIDISNRNLPFMFSAAAALKVVVSDDGTRGGGATGATQGTARLYVVTASPVALT